MNKEEDLMHRDISHSTVIGSAKSEHLSTGSELAQLYKVPRCGHHLAEMDHHSDLNTPIYVDRTLK